MEISNTLKFDNWLAKIDTQKGFDTICHSFLISTWQKYGFDSKCVNGYLKKGTRQDDPIFAYLFILVLEIAFLSIKENKNIKRLNIFNQTFLYTTYTDDATFFLKDKKYLIEIMKVFDILLSFSGLTPNRSKCEVAGIGALKGAKLALYSMKCIDLKLNNIEILDIHFLYKKKVENNENFLKHSTNIEKLLKYGKSKIWN